MLLLAGAAALAAGGPVHLKRTPVPDPNYGLDAHYFLIPAGWALESKISYNPAPSLSLSSVVHIHDKAGITGVLMLGGESAYTWGSGPVWEMYLNSGTSDGTYNGLRIKAPQPPEEYLRQVCLPTFRQLYPNFSLTESRPDPRTAEIYRISQNRSGMAESMAAAGVRMDYQAVFYKGTDLRNGQPVEAEGTLLLTYVYSSSDGMNSSCIWGLTSLRMYFAKQGQLQTTLPLLQSVVRSGRPNPQWYVRMSNHRNQVWKIARDAQAEVGRIIDEMNASLRDRDRIYEGFSEYIRGTSVYQDPTSGRFYELESGHNQVWFGSGGDVIYTDDFNYSPNTDPRYNHQSWSEGRSHR